MKKFVVLFKKLWVKKNIKIIKIVKFKMLKVVKMVKKVLVDEILECKVFV